MISIVTALAIVAFICGRYFNINDSGLNIYLTLLMNTGEGKDIINDFISRVMDDAEIFSGSFSFLGKKRYTGPKPLIEDLQEKRCMGCVFTEAGFMFSSKTGDQLGLTRTILDLIGKSGRYGVMQGEGYSDKKNSIPTTQSPCFSMVNESTPDIFLEALRGGTETGELTRMHLLKATLDNTDINRDKKYLLTGDNEVKAKLKSFMVKFAPLQKQDNPAVVDIEVREDMWAFVNKCKADSKALVDDDKIKSRMLSRSGLKTWKVASLLSVMNNEVDFDVLSDIGTELKIDDESWKWAESLHEYEMYGLKDFFKVEGQDQLEDIISNHLLKPIARLIQPKGCEWPEYKSQHEKLTSMDKQNSVCPVSKLRQVTRKVIPIKELGSARLGKDGLMIVLRYMESAGYIKMRGKTKFKVEQEFFNREW